MELLFVLPVLALVIYGIVKDYNPQAVLAIAGMGNGEAIAGIILTRAIILFVTIVAGWVLYQQVVMKYGKRPDAPVQR